MVGVWRARCARVEGHPIPDCGHFLPEEQPEAVAAAILDFVRTT
jgi:pimeloyl-ACP methyl ester carboxylesterase